MGLSGGSRIGSFEVVGILGTGGMGEVYRARDLKLGREVALKVLPEELAQDGERVARFKREAQVLASLNHPHIAAIHGVEEWTSEGVARQALVLELVEGPTLADRIARGALPLDEALAVARQIADALDAAHDLGIVHRDLKPANIKLTDDDRVKVLDFGLAKAVEGAGSRQRAAGRESPSMAPTITTPAMPFDYRSGHPEQGRGVTMAGTILGTAAYMAPEQAKGREADRRSDVWAFGAVLYEMLTGRRAFDGEDVSDTLAAVLRGEPDWSALPIETPPGVRSALRRCLERDRKRRLHTAGDALVLVEEVRLSSPSGVTSGAVERGAWRTRWALAVVALVAAGVLALMGAAFLEPDAPRQASVVSLTPPEGFALNRSTGLNTMAVSPDGRRIVFQVYQRGQTLLALRDLSASESTLIQGTELATYPFWSPGGEQVGFFQRGLLRAADLTLGAIRTISQVNGAGRGGTWGDGFILFAATGSPEIFRVDAGGGTPAKVTSMEGTTGLHRYPHLLPDGRRFVFSVQGRNEIRLGSLDSAASRKLADADSEAVISGPTILFVRQGKLVARPFDARAGDVSGAEGVVSEGMFVDGNAYAQFGIGGSTVAYVSGVGLDTTRLMIAGRDGRSMQPLLAPGPYRNPSVSRDGTRVAVEMSGGPGATRDIWVIDRASAVTSRLTFDPGNDVFPTWSADGRQIYFGSDRTGGVSSIYEKPADGSSMERVLFASTDENTVPYSLSPDGRFLLHRFIYRGAFNFGVIPLDGEQKSRVFAPSTFAQATPEVHPNGRFVAYQTNETGPFEVMLQTFPEQAGKWQVSREGGVNPVWSRDGRELIYYAGDGRLTRVPVKLDGAVAIGTPVPMFEVNLLNGPNSTVGFRRQFDLLPDGQFLLNIPVGDVESPALTLILDWRPTSSPGTP